METGVLKSEPSELSADVLRQAGHVLRQGGLVAFPTETVYGVGARADHPGAMKRLREVKTREATKAFTVHIASRDEVGRFAPDMPRLAARLIRKAWPGPLTLILRVNDPAAVPAMSGLNGSASTAMFYDNTIGLRCPDDAFAQSLLRAVDAPIVAASANLAGEPPPWTGDDVLRGLDGKIDLLIDTGRTKYAKPSTIVRVIGDSLELVREGVLDGGSVDRLSTVRILFVCTGNTCRSPMAAKLAERILAEDLACTPQDLPRHGIFVSSAGTSGGLGGASQHAIDVMAQRGIDLSAHGSSALTADLIHQADYIYVMTRSHREAAVRLAPTAKHRVQLLLDDDVQDPMGGDREDYERIAQNLEQGLRARLPEVIT